MCHLTLVQIQTDHVSSSEESHHDTQRVEPHGADGKVTRPPCAQANEENKVDRRERRWKSYACRGNHTNTAVVMDKATDKRIRYLI